MEYAAAKSTICRQCGSSFAPSAPKVEVKLRPKAEPAVVRGEEGESSLLQKFEGLWTRQRNSIVECFECKMKQEVIGNAISTNCRKCSAHLDLRDYKIATAFSRSIRTHGDVHITAKGDLSSSTVTCHAAQIEGKLRGNLHCAGTATINFTGKIPGRLSARHVLIERKAEVQFFRQLKVGSIEIRGRMVGEIVAETVVVIHRNASLEGNVTAKSISVEKGGLFSGQLVIGTGGLQQAELIPALTPVPASEEEVSFAAAMPLPAT